MPNINRRTLLYGFGLASVTPVMAWQATAAKRVAVCKPGESRFAFASSAQAQTSPCKVSSDDTNGACTVFEPNAFLHVHHREDEWYYVLLGEFIFRAGGEEHSLVTGASIWLPRGIPHVWANTATTDAKLILMCQPGGFDSGLMARIRSINMGYSVREMQNRVFRLSRREVSTHSI